MKKFLFTLATLIAAGFAANASMPQLGLSDTEITLGAGEAQEVHIVLLQQLDDIMKGAQIQFVMYNPAGERIADQVILEKKYARNKQWFGPEGPSTANEDVGGAAGNALGTSNPFPAKYRALWSNASTNEVWYDDVEAPCNVAVFSVKVAAEDWADEYAILRLECNTADMIQAGEDEYPIKFVMNNGIFLMDDGAMELKINNADYTAPQDKELTGEIVFGDLDENGTFTVSYDGPEEVTLTITVNGEAVELVDGAYTLPGYGEYEVTATATADGYVPANRMKIFTWEEPVVEQTAAPEVNFEMRGEELWCVITGEGDIYVDDTNYGPAPVEFLVTVQTTEEQEGSFFVYALAEGKTQSETVRANWTCEAKEVVVEYAETPVITYDEETFTVTATSADEVHLFINGNPVEGNTYTFEQTTEEVTYQVTAYASAEGKEDSPYASKEVVVPAKEVEYTAVPVVTVEVTDDAYIITATGDGEVTLYVDGVEVENPYTVVRPETEPEEPYAIYVYATAQEDGKEMSSSEVQRIVIEPKPAPQPQPTPEPEVTIDVTDDAIIINVDGEGDIHVYVDGEEVENPYIIPRGDEDVTVVVTATAQEEGKEISETATEEITVPAKEVTPEPNDYKIEPLWDITDLSFLTTNDVRQGFGMNGKFYINDKAAMKVLVLDENGLANTEFEGGANCGITRDEAGNLVISNATFPGAWEEATIKVINPETNEMKVYTVPVECGVEGRCDFLGFARGNLMEDGVIYLTGATNAGVSIMTIEGGEVNADECYVAPCDGLSPTSSTVINYYTDLAGEDALLYVTRNAALVKIAFDGSDLVPATIALPGKGACNGTFPFIWDEKEFFVYPTLPNYLDGFAVAEAGADAPIVEVPATYAANANVFQADWLNAEICKDNNEKEYVTIYQYYPGGYIAVYMLYKGDRPEVGGIEEITNDTNKVVAGMRYYNILGQEMIEANGLTIVVTTYTDGSSSAAKVIK